MSTPAIILNSSPARWAVVDAMLSLPGLALAYAMNSGTVFAATDGWTTITSGTRMMPATGVTGEIHFVDSGYNIIAMPHPDALRGETAKLVD